MILSLSGSLFEDGYTAQSVSLSEFCAIAEKAGYSGVEVRDTQINISTTSDKRREFLKMASDRGLAVTCLIARQLPEGGVERDEFFLRYLDLCNDLDCRLLKILSDPAWLKGAAFAAKERWVVLAAENHVNSPLETVSGTKDFIKAVSSRNFGLLYDCCNLNIAGEEYLSCIPEFAKVTKNILVHSARPAPDGEWIKAMPDEPGVQDWKGVFARFKKKGYDGLVTVIENGWPQKDRERIARHCAKVIREYMSV